jgi:glycosyltransferase 2 family protein
VLAARVGTQPFVAGLEAVGPASVVAALVLTALTTLASAQRWRLVGRAYGVRMTLRSGVAAYYRSQFLNSVLPGGVLGDVHRGVTHRAMGSVVAERVVGQAVQVALAGLVVLVAWPVTAKPSTLLLTAAALGGVLLLAVVVLVLVARDWLEVEVVPPVLALSALAAAGHAAVFVVAARAAGVDVGTGLLAALALAVLVVAAIPVNLAGWGLREGAAAWAFAAAGLGAATGATVAVAYGVLALVATLPGAVLLLTRTETRRLEARQVVVHA